VGRSRKKPSLGQQCRILTRFGNACGICGQLLNVRNLHHIEFFARGGDDSDENFIPLHPTCHHLFPHKLEHIVSTDRMKQLQDLRIEFNRLDALISNKICSSASDAALVLLDPAVQPLVLRFGSYGRYLQFALDIDKELVGPAPSTHALRDCLRVFAADMALYLDRENDFLDVALASTSRLDRSSELSSAAKAGWLVCSRLAGRVIKTKTDVEERFLERSYPGDSAMARNDLWNWYFRALAFYKKTGQYNEFDSLTKAMSLLCGQPDELTKANIQSEIARVRLYRGDPEAAYTLFSELLTSSIQSFHLRGIFLTALFLARAAVCANRYSGAAEALLICEQFRGQVARDKENADFESLRIDLERIIGRDNLLAIWAKA